MMTEKDNIKTKAKQSEKRKPHTKIKTVTFNKLKEVETTNIVNPVGVPPVEDETIIKTVPPLEDNNRKSKVFHEYTLKAEVNLSIFLSDPEKKKLQTQTKKNSLISVEDYILCNLKDITLSIDNILNISNESKDCYNKQEDTLKIHNLNRYKPKLFSKANIIKDSKQLTLDESILS